MGKKWQPLEKKDYLYPRIFLTSFHKSMDTIQNNQLVNETGPTPRAILMQMLAVMNKEGKVLIVEMAVPEINIPSPAKMLDLQMLVMEGGKERTKDEFQNLLNSAGFHLTNIHATKSLFSIIEGKLA
jgi:O-methyltransferase domain